MATIDSLDIRIAGSAKKANDAIDGLITNLNRLATALKIDTSGLEKIGKSLNFSGIDKAAKNTQSQAQKVSKSLSQITEQYKDLGKRFEFKGSIPSLKKQIDSYSNALEKAKLKMQELEASEKTEGKGYEDAVKNVLKYENILESLNKQLSRMSQTVPEIDLKITGLNEAEQKISSVSEKLRTVSLPQSAFNYNADAMKAVFGEMSEGIKNWEQATEKYGAQAGEVLNETFSKAANQADNFSEKIKKAKDGTEKAGESTKKAKKETDSLDDAFRKISASSNSFSNSLGSLGKNLNKTLSNIKSVTRSILSAVGIMGGLYGVIRGLQKSIDISSQLTEVQNVVDVTFGNMAYKVEEFAETSIEKFGMSELTLKQISSRFQAMGTAMGFPIDRMSDMSVELTKLAADMSSFYNVSQEDVSKSLESIFTGTTRPMRQYGIDLTQATLQEWALKMGLMQTYSPCRRQKKPCSAISMYLQIQARRKEILREL